MTAARMGRKPGPLAAALSAPPTLDGAACIGRWSLFDPQHDHEPAADTTRRHRTALRICQACPVLAACHRWAATLPATHRPAGVLVGYLSQIGTPEPDHVVGVNRRTVERDMSGGAFAPPEPDRSVADQILDILTDGTPPAGVSRADVSDNLSLTPAGPGVEVRATPSAGSCARRAGGPA